MSGPLMGTAKARGLPILFNQIFRTTSGKDRARKKAMTFLLRAPPPPPWPSRCSNRLEMRPYPSLARERPGF